MANILLIDDDSVSRMACAHLLRRRGHLVIEAADGYVGTDIYARCHPDIVVLDIYMPRQDGFETIRAIRNSDMTIPIIVLTTPDTMIDLSVLIIAKLLGANNGFYKPVSDEFCKFIDQLDAECLPLMNRILPV